MAQTITMENVEEAFDLILQLGVGSKGQVWLAHSPGHVGGPIALKLLHPEARPDLSAGGRLWESLGDHLPPPVASFRESAWEPSLDGSAVDEEPTDRFAAVTAVSWTTTHRPEPVSGVAKP